ncbi:DUF2913 family protein [Pantoea endophytica]
MKEYKKNNHQLDAAHFAWCCLIALHFARLDDVNFDDLDEHDFLIKWLSNAYVEERFVALANSEIAWLLKQAWSQGMEAHIRSKLELLYHAGKGSMNEDSDLLKLTQAVNKATLMGWGYFLLPLKTFRKAILRPRLSQPGILLVSRDSLDRAFNEYGEQIRPITVRISGELPLLQSCLFHSDWSIKSSAENEHFLGTTGFFN